MCHTNEVSDNMTLVFMPTGLEAAFALFHYFGMLGTSEAAAESVRHIEKIRPSRVKHRPRSGINSSSLEQCAWNRQRRCVLADVLGEILRRCLS